MPTKPTPDQFEFDGVFEYGPSRQNFTVAEVADKLGISDTQVRALLDTGVFACADINDDPNAERKHVRIARFSVVAYWREAQLARNGVELPLYQSPAVVSWRNVLRQRRGLPPLAT